MRRARAHSTTRFEMCTAKCKRTLKPGKQRNHRHGSWLIGSNEGMGERAHVSARLSDTTEEKC